MDAEMDERLWDAGIEDASHSDFINFALILSGGRIAFTPTDAWLANVALRYFAQETGTVGSLIYSRATVERSAARKKDLDIVRSNDENSYEATCRLTGTFRPGPGAAAGTVTLYALTAEVPMDSDGNEIRSRNGKLVVGPPCDRSALVSAATFDISQLREATTSMKRMAAAASLALPAGTWLGGFCIAGYHVEVCGGPRFIYVK